MLGKGPDALLNLPGISMDERDRQFYYDYFVGKHQRNPTIVEIMDLNNANSEHSRHGYFRGRQVVDGVEQQDGTLFDVVKATLKANPKGSLVAFGDNSSVSAPTCGSGCWGRRNKAEGRSPAAPLFFLGQANVSRLLAGLRRCGRTEAGGGQIICRHLRAPASGGGIRADGAIDSDAGRQIHLFCLAANTAPMGIINDILHVCLDTLSVIAAALLCRLLVSGCLRWCDCCGTARAHKCAQSQSSGTLQDTAAAQRSKSIHVHHSLLGMDMSNLLYGV